MSRTVVSAVALLTTLAALSVTVSAQWDGMDQAEVQGHPMYTVFEPGFIPAVLEPEFISVSEAQELYHPDEPLVVVADASGAHGYSLWHMEQHLVVNDFVDGRAITITW